jgi:hypothetical protein
LKPMDTCASSYKLNSNGHDAQCLEGVVVGVAAVRGLRFGSIACGSRVA